MLSTPVCGVEMRNETTAPFPAPCSFSESATGRTPQEHKGSGTPKSRAGAIWHKIVQNSHAKYDTFPIEFSAGFKIQCQTLSLSLFAIFATLTPRSLPVSLSCAFGAWSGMIHHTYSRRFFLLGISGQSHSNELNNQEPIAKVEF